MPRSVPAPPRPQRCSSSHASPPPPPCPVYLIIIVFKHAQYMPRSVPAPIAPSALPASSGSVYLMLLPLPPCPVYPIIIIFKHAQCMPRSVPAPAVQFISAPMPRLSPNNSTFKCYHQDYFLLRSPTLFFPSCRARYNHLRRT